MNYFKWILGGGTAGLLGATIWAAIVHYTNYEVGYVAWGIGAAVGYGVRKMAGEEGGAAPGVVAALIAVVALVAGKYAVAAMSVHGAIPDAAKVVTAESMHVTLATEICIERDRKGEKLKFPPGMDLVKAEKQADFPPEVWKEATETWNKLPPDQQQQRLAERRTMFNDQIQEMEGEIRQKAFEQSFGMFDLLWLFLAVGSAFKIGANQVGSD